MTRQRTLRGRYEAWHRNLDVNEGANEPWHRLVKVHLEPGRDLVGRRVLEIGCGRGGFTCWLARHPARPVVLVAADIAATAIEKGRAFALQEKLSWIAWEVCDIHAICHPDSSFDTVISCETVEHVHDPRRTLREISRVLKPGGRLFLSVPNYCGSMGLYRAYLMLRGRKYTEVGQPINRLTLLPVTRRWIKRAGLQIACIDAVGHYLPLPGRPPIELASLNDPRRVMRWLGLHSVIVAVKPY